MPEAFQRLFQHTAWQPPQSLKAQAGLGLICHPERSQFSLLIRHFLERFLNYETASADDGRARIVQIASATALPGLVIAIYLWPAYHPFPGWPPGHKGFALPPYWAQVNHHFFFVTYSFVVMGLIALFEWDLFFPDLLDVLVLGPLPISAVQHLRARVSAIAVLLFGFLFNINILALLVLPLSTDPPQLTNFLRGHLSAVALAGLFSSGSMFALQAILLAVFGEKLIRRMSLVLQGALVAGFLILLLLFPILSSVAPHALQSNAAAARFFPPFWFLGTFEQSLPAAGNLPAWPQLARLGEIATAVVWGTAIAAYPLAYVRRVRAIVQGVSIRRSRNWLVIPMQRLLHASCLREPLQRSAFHFISQTMLRIPRYRIYLVMYGGAGVSLVTATVLRLHFQHNRLQVELSADGIRIAIGIIAFWVAAGLRSAFVSTGDQQAGWIFRSIHGKPPDFEAASAQLQATLRWVFLATLGITTASIAGFQIIAPATLRTAPSLAAQLTTGVCACLLLTDAFFLNITWIPFTGDHPIQEDNIAFTILRYYTFFPFVTLFSYLLERGIEHGGAQLGVPVISITIAHFWLRKWHQDLLRESCAQIAAEDGEDDSLLRLGLRY